jgi:hypothetical protein
VQIDILDNLSPFFKIFGAPLLKLGEPNARSRIAPGGLSHGKKPGKAKSAFDTGGKHSIKRVIQSYIK